jgi:hypothetical protein
MLPYNEKIRSFEDVRKEYPKFFDLSLLENKYCKECIRKEEAIIKEKVKTDRGHYKISKAEIKELIQARGLYRFLYCWENLVDQSISTGAKGDIIQLIKKCKNKGSDPFNPYTKALFVADDKTKTKLNSFLGSKGRYNNRKYEITDKDTDDRQDDDLL